MVVFNPEVQPFNPPNWTGVSRPISDVAGDKSKALAISATADTLDAGVKVAENIDQDIIKEKTRAGVEALRGATTSAYESARTSLLQGTAVDPRAANVAGLSLLKNAQADLPAGLESGLDRAQELGSARAQGTLKANDTLYTGALDSLAKQLRAEYPGHKDFIDEQMSRISGKNPANAYMDNLLTDISRLSTGQDAVEKRVVSKAMENYGDINVYNALRSYQAKLPGSFNTLQNAVFGAEKSKIDHQRTMNGFQEDEAAGKIDTELVKSQAQKSAQDTVYRNFNGIIETAGLKPQIVQQLITESRQGKITTMSPDQWESLAQALEASRDQTLNQMKDNFNRYGISRRLKDPTGEQAIMNNEIQFYDRAISAIRDPNKGTFFELQRRAKGLQDATNYQTLSDPNIGEYLRKMDIIKEKAGPNWTAMIDQLGLNKGYLGKMGNWFNETSQKIGVPDDPRLGDTAKSLTADIATARKAAAQGTKFDPRLYEDLVKNVDLIEEANKQGRPDIAKEVVKYMFDPQRNKDFVKQWSRDFTDANGVQHKGYFAYYDMMSRPRVVDNIYKLGDQEAWLMHKNWQENSFRQLFGNETQALNTIQGNTANPAIMAWDSDKNRMHITFENKPQTTVDANYQRWATESVNKLNSGIQNLAHMYRVEGTEPSEGIFTTLMGMSYKPREGLSGVNLPKMVIDSINASQFQPSEEERLRSSFQRLGK